MTASAEIAKSGAANFEEAVGGRQNLVEVLATSVRDTKQDILFRMLSDPLRQTDSLVSICTDAGVATHEILSMFRQAVVAKGLVAAQTTMADKLGPIARDVAEKAMDHVKPCRCRLLSQSDTALPSCENCGGSGEVYREGSLDHAKTVFEATGLTSKGGGVNVQVQQTNVVGGGGALLDKFVHATDAASFDIMDAEVTKEPTAEKTSCSD